MMLDSELPDTDSDIGECVHCGTPVYPWHLGCEGCGKTNWSVPVPDPECYICGYTMTPYMGLWSCNSCQQDNFDDDLENDDG